MLLWSREPCLPPGRARAPPPVAGPPAEFGGRRARARCVPLGKVIKGDPRSLTANLGVDAEAKSRQVGERWVTGFASQVSRGSNPMSQSCREGRGRGTISLRQFPVRIIRPPQTHGSLGVGYHCGGRSSCEPTPKSRTTQPRDLASAATSSMKSCTSGRTSASSRSSGFT
jgi:hypothetical protein